MKHTLLIRKTVTVSLHVNVLQVSKNLQGVTVERHTQRLQETLFITLNLDEDLHQVLINGGEVRFNPFV